MAQRFAVFRNVYGPGERHEWHAHGYSNVSVVLAGSLRERVGRAESVAGPLSVVAKPAGTEHVDVFGPRGAVLLQLPLARRWIVEQEDGTRAVEQWRWSTSPDAARWLLRLAMTGSTAIPCSIDDGIAECLGAVYASEPREHDKPVPDWLARIREQIRDERGRGAGVGQLAREAGVHPVYLTRRFRRAYGCSVTAALQAERVRAAADMMGSRDETLSGIAYGTGFADQPHLTRTFRRVAGLTPAVYRRLARLDVEVENVQARSRDRR